MTTPTDKSEGGFNPAFDSATPPVPAPNLAALRSERQAAIKKGDLAKIQELARRELVLLTGGSARGEFLLDLANLFARQFSRLDLSVAYSVQAADQFRQDRDLEEKAFSLYLQALSLEPTHQAAFAGLAKICSQRRYWDRLPTAYRKYLERFLSENQRWDDLVHLYKTEVEIPEDSREAAMTYLKLGEILENHMERPEGALNAYKMALALLPQDLRAFEAVSRLYRNLNRHQDLVHLLRDQFEVVSGKDRKRTLALETARLEWQELKNPQKALEACKWALALDVNDRPTLELLAQICEALNNWTELFSLLQGKVKSVEEPSLRAWLCEYLGHVCEYHLGKTAEAVAYFEQCLSLAPGNAVALKGLDFIYSKRGDIDRLIPILVERASQSRDGLEKARLFGRLGRLYSENKKNPRQAESYFRRIVDTTESKLFGLQLLERMYRDTGNIEAKVKVAQERAALYRDPETQRNFLLALAHELEAQLKRPDLAEKIYKDVNRAGAENTIASSSLKRLYRDQERWQELYQLCKAELKNPLDEIARVENLLLLGEMEEYQLDRLNEAQSFYYEVFQLNPRNLKAIKGLERIYLKQAEWAKLLEIYRQGMEIAQDLKEEAYLCLRMAQVTEKMAADSKVDEVARKDLLKESARHFEAALLRDPELFAAIRSLIPIYEKLGDWEQVLRIRMMYVEKLEDNLLRAEQYFNIGEMFEDHLRQPEKAAENFETASRLNPDHPGVMRRLAVFYFQNEDWEKARNVHEAIEARFEPGEVTDRQQYVAFYFRLGQIYFKLNRFSDATATLLKAKKLNPKFTPVRRLLAQLYFVDHKWRALREELSEVLEVLEPAEQIDGLLKLAAAEIGMNDLRNAEMHLQEVLTRDPLNDTAMTTLKNLYQAGGKLNELVQLYEKRLLGLRTPEIQIHEGLQLAQLQWEVVKDSAGAGHTLDLLFKQFPAEQKVFAAYKDFLRRTRQSDRLLEVLEGRLTQQLSLEERRFLLLEYAEMLEGAGQNLTEAERIYSELLEEDHDSIPILKGLGRIYLKQKRWAELVEIYEHERRLATRDEDAAVLSFKIGELESGHLNRPEEATSNYQDAIRKDPTLVPALHALRKLFENEKQWDRIPSLIIQEMEVARGRGEEARLHFELARLFEDKLDQKEKAIKHYENALSLNPEYLPAARRMAVHYYQTSDWANAEKYYDILARDLRSNAGKEAPPQMVAGFFYKYGRIAERVGKEEKAVDCFRRSLEFDREFFPSLAALADLCERRQWWEEAKLCLEQILRKVPEELHAQGSRLEEWHFRLANVEAALGNKEMAIARHKEVLKHDPQFLPSMEALARYYEEEKKWRLAAGLYDKIIELAAEKGDQEKYNAALLKRGGILREHLNNPTQAIEDFQKIQATDQGQLSQQALSGLIESYMKQGDWVRAASLIEEKLKDENDPSSRSYPHQLALAECYLNLNEQAKCDKALTAVLHEMPNNLKAIELRTKLLEKREDWQQLALNLQRYLNAMPQDDKKELGRIYHDLGDLQQNRLMDQEKAVKMFRKALEVDPERLDTHRRLATLYGQNENFYQQAVNEHLFLLTTEPFNPDSYHTLGQIFEVRGDWDKAICIYEALSLLGFTVERERSLLRRFRANRKVIDEVLDEPSFEKYLRDPLDKGSIGRIWHQVRSYCETLFGSDGETLAIQTQGLRKVDREGASSKVKIIAEVARLVDVGDFDIYLSSEKEVKVEVIASRPPGLSVNAEILKSPKKMMQYFVFGKAFAQIRWGYVLPLMLPETQLRRLFLLIAKVVREDLILEGFEEKGLKADLKQIKRAIPKKVRVDLEPDIDEFLKDLRKIDFQPWLESLRKSANRVGLLLAQDLFTAIDALRVEAGQSYKGSDLHDPREFMKFLQMNRQALDLFKFYCTPAFFALRERFGLAHTGLVV